MKIHVLPVPSFTQPNTQGFIAPPGNHDWGVEQDFRNFILCHPEYQADREMADWYYLPVFWNRYYILNDWGNAGLDELKQAVEQAIDGLDGSRIFTVCEYDLYALSKFIDLRGGVVMCSSRRGDGRFIEIPLLRSRHKTINAKKWIFASFTGNTQTDGIRMDMEEACKDLPDVICNHEFKSPELWAQMVESSYIALCPRGQGMSSFRFYEAMQLGTVPLHIGAPDVRPFQNQVDWDSCSLYAESVQEMLSIMHRWRDSKERLGQMGRNAKLVFDTKLGYGKWCQLALNELEGMG